MRSGLSDTLGDIGIDLSVTLGTFEIDASFLRELLETRTLPLGKPSLWVGFRSRIFRVEILGILDCSLSLAVRHEYFSTSFGLLDDIPRLLLFSLLRHALLNQTLNVIVIILHGGLWLRKLLLDLRCLLQTAAVDQETQVTTDNLVVTRMSLIQRSDYFQRFLWRHLLAYEKQKIFVLFR